MATFKGNEFFCYDLSLTPIQSSTDEITLSFRTLQRNGLMLHTGKSADYVNLSLKSGAVWLVINLGSGAFEALVEPVNGKFNDNAWHDVRVTRNLRQVKRHDVIGRASMRCFSLAFCIFLSFFSFKLFNLLVYISVYLPLFLPPLSPVTFSLMLVFFSSTSRVEICRGLLWSLSLVMFSFSEKQPNIHVICSLGKAGGKGVKVNSVEKR